LPVSFDRFRIERLDNGSLGLSRQQGLVAARAHYVQFCDEDDLVSSNMTLDMYAAARAADSRTIVIPEYLFGFGAVHVLAHYCGTDRISPLIFLAQHPFVSRIFVHRSIAEHVRYRDVPIGSGYAYEDWTFNATAVAAGFDFKPAPDTVLFYRHRGQSMLASMNRGSTRQIPPTPLFEPAMYMRVCREDYYRRQTGEVPQVNLEVLRRRFLDNPLLQEFVCEANRIDPAVDLAPIASAPIMSNLVGDYALGEAYFEACRIVGRERFTDVVLTTEVGPFTAQRQGRDVASALAATRSGIRTLILLHRADAASETGEMALNSVLLDLASLRPGLSADQIDTIGLRLIEATAPAARLHLTANSFAMRFFGKYRKVLGHLSSIFYRTDDPVRRLAGSYIRSGGAFDFLSEHLEGLSLIVTDNDALIAFDRERIDRSPEKWRRLYRAGGALPVPRLVTRRVLAMRPVREAIDFDRIGRLVSEGREPITIEVAEVAPSLAALADYDVLIVSEVDALDYSTCWLALSAGVAMTAPASSAGTEATSGHAGVLFEQKGDATSTEEVLAEALRTIYASGKTALAFRRRARELFDRRHLWPAFESGVREIFP
jgi:hypothetical protein